MNEKKFTPAANKVISLAYGEAVSMGHGYVGSEHLLLGIMRCEEGRAAHILSSFGLDYDALCAKITEEIGSGDFATDIKRQGDDPVGTGGGISETG